MDNLRPSQLHDLIGQAGVRQRLAISINAALARGEALGHVLFDGPPGLGKTTLAVCVANALGVKVQIANAAALATPRDLLPLLTQAEGGVIFIDEIHRLSMAVEEFLYPAVEDFRVDMLVGEGMAAKIMNLKLQPFTLIGATTRAGAISAPLRDRFRLRETLEFYSDAELAQLVTRNAQKLGVSLPAGGAARIAACSRGTPRIANNRLYWIRDHGADTLEQLTKALTMLGLDERGLDAKDRKYLDALRVFGGGPIGVSALAHTLSIDEDTVQNEIEPYLLRQQLITRTPRGRKLVTA